MAGRQFGYGVLATGIGVAPLRLACNDAVNMKPVGVTIDWGTVAAVSGSDVTLKDGTVIAIGKKYLRYGQLLCRITRQGVVTITITGTPTGGSFTETITDPSTGQTYVVTVPYNSSVAAHQTLINTALGTGQLTAGGAGVLPANAHTLTATSGGRFSGYALTAPTIDITLLTGGTPAATSVVTFSGVTTGMYGPYDPDATDGRQTLANGECGLLDTTVTELDLVTGLAAKAADYVGLIVGGNVWYARLLATTGTHTLAAGPTFTELLAVLPRLQFVKDNV